MIIQHGQNPYVPGAKQEVFNPDQLIAGNLQVVTKTATITGGDYKRGAVLGTVDGIKYTLCKKSAVDGSEKPAAILVDGVNALSVDKTGGLYLMGEFNANAVIFDPTWTIDELTILLESSNIYLRKPVSAPAV